MEDNMSTTVNQMNQVLSQGFIWSLASTKNGGFYCGADVTNVVRLSDTLLSGTVNGVDDYEFFDEQFVALNPNIWVQEDIHNKLVYCQGTKVSVYARQNWGQQLDGPINGTVYQSQIGGSVIVSVSPNDLPDRHVVSKGGCTIEVYPQQLRPSQHTDFHVTLSSPDAIFINSEFVMHKKYRPIRTWKSLIYQYLNIT
jgi:hypothetical protein